MADSTFRMNPLYQAVVKLQQRLSPPGLSLRLSAELQ